MSFYTKTLASDDGWVDIKTEFSLDANTIYGIRPNSKNSTFWVAQNAMQPTGIDDAVQIIDGFEFKFKADELTWVFTETESLLVVYESFLGESTGTASVVWGGIGGDINNQADLIAELNSRAFIRGDGVVETDSSTVSEPLTIANSLSYQFISASPYSLTTADDKRLLYLGGATPFIINLSAISTVNKNFSARVTIATNSVDRVIRFNSATDNIDVNGTNFPATTNVDLTLARGSSFYIDIIRDGGSTWLIKGVFKASETAAGISQFSTQAEVNAASETAKTVTPGTLGKAQASGVASLDANSFLQQYNIDQYVNSVGWVCGSAASGGDGSFMKPFNTIQAALNNAGAGNTAVYYVSPGNYTENLTFPAGFITKLIAIGSEKESFGGSLTTVDVIGTANITTGAHSIDGFGISGLVTLNNTGTTLDVFTNCTLSGGYTVTGASDANLILQGGKVTGAVTHSSSVNTFQCVWDEVQGDLSSGLTCTTDNGLLYINNCSQMHYIDYQGSNLYIDGMQSIGKNVNTTIKFRGPGAVAQTGFCTLNGTINVSNGATSILDISCNTLTDGLGVVYNTGAANVVNYNTKITPSALP